MRWFAMATRFLTDPKVEQLGEKHGPAGPLIFTALLAEVAAQDRELAGEVEVGLRSIAMATFSDPETVRLVVADMIELGVAEDVSQNLGHVSHGAHLVFPTWEKYQQNWRQDKSRAGRKKPHGKAKSEDVSQNLGHVSQHSTDNTDSTDREKDDNGDPILLALDAVAFSRELSLKHESARKACEQFADRDLPAEVARFAAYWTEGPGEKRSLKDVAWAWRNWLSKADPAPQKTSEKFAKYDQKIRRAA